MKIDVATATGHSGDRVAHLRPRATQRQSTDTSIASQLLPEFHEKVADMNLAIGKKLDHKNLPWATGFPLSHDYHHARGSEEGVYIAVPRKTDVNENGKRPARDFSPDGTPRRPMEIL
jgi:hypothetical protein